ncbi:MAG: polysaccharide deacetylase family protein [Lachnospiraceae bacterium]|nr:polysaccharide deacetylase family protein [Lachnospiraceae bacterium]
MKILHFEGYIRNRRKLMQELNIREGLSAQKTECEIITEAYKKWGHLIGDHLYGSFAITISDDEKNEIFCVRDQLGIEQLFYHVTPSGRLLAGSDIKVITSDPQFEKKLDPLALQLYMIFGYPAGERTLYEGIRKLMPGNYLVFKDGKVSITSYSRIEFCPDNTVAEDEWKERICKTLQEILDEDRDDPDFNNCTSFLSGGVDSGFLLYASGAKKACSIGYEDSAVSETLYASETAAALGAKFEETDISADEFFAAIPDAVRDIGLPTADASTIAFYKGCRKKASAGGIYLSGEGIDELFAGYHVYRRSKELGGLKNERYLGCSGLMSPDTARQLLGQEDAFSCEELVKDLYNGMEDLDNLSRMLSVDLALWFEGDILPGVTRSSRAAGIKLILPYSDIRMAELACKIPSGLKRKDGISKYIFRKTAADHIPHETAFREKLGFAVPVKDWLTDESRRKEIDKILFGKTSSALFDQTLLHKFLDNSISDIRDLQRVYAIYVFIIWYENCFLDDGNKTADFRDFLMDDPRYSREKAWPEERFPDANYHYIRDTGCLVCAISYMLRKNGIEKESDINAFNPWIFTMRLIESGAFTPAADLNLFAISSLYPLLYEGPVRYSEKRLIEYAENGYLCLLTVPGQKGIHHFIALDHILPGDASVFDPKFGMKLLSDYGRVLEIRPFRPYTGEIKRPVQVGTARSDKDRHPLSDKTPKRVALTFDDGPAGETSLRIMECLTRHSAKATFFVIGENISEHSNLLKLMKESGFAIGIHTWNHESICFLSEDKCRENLKRTADAVTDACGAKVSLMRPSFGLTSESTQKAAADLGLATIGWSIDSGDWRVRDPGKIIKSVLENINDGDIILLHDIYKETVDAADILIFRLKEMGFELLTVDELAACYGGLVPGKIYYYF